MQKKLNRAIKVRLYPTDRQMAAIMGNIGCCRFVHNYMVTYCREGHRVLSFMEMSAMLPGLKKKFPWLGESDSAALQRAVRDLSRVYSMHFSNPKHFGWPVLHSRKKSRLSYTTPHNGGNACLLDSGVKLPKIGIVKTKVSREVPASWRQLSVTVSVTRTGKVFASVACEVETEVPETPVDRSTSVGLDYKSDGLFVSSDGVTAGSPKYYRKTERRLAHQQRMLSKKQGFRKGEKPSASFLKQKKKVAALHEKASCQREDYLHKMSTEIANQYDTVCVEDLDMKAMSNKGFDNGKATLENGYGMLLGMLAYKLDERGGRLVKVSRWFPSSQTCSVCGAIHPEMKDLSMRTMRCGCGNVMDRDLNAAINIMNEGLRMLGA